MVYLKKRKMSRKFIIYAQDEYMSVSYISMFIKIHHPQSFVFWNESIKGNTLLLSNV